MPALYWPPAAASAAAAGSQPASQLKAGLPALAEAGSQRQRCCFRERQAVRQHCAVNVVGPHGVAARRSNVPAMQQRRGQCAGAEKAPPSATADVVHSLWHTKRLRHRTSVPGQTGCLSSLLFFCFVGPPAQREQHPCVTCRHCTCSHAGV